MLRFPSTQRMMNFVSSFDDSRRSCYIMFCLSVWELFPFVLVILIKLLKTFYMVKGTGCFRLLMKKLIVFWPDLHLWAAKPRSPVSFTRSLIMETEDPQLRATAFIKIYFPIPSSYFSYSGPHLMMDSQYPLTRSSVDLLTSSLNILER